MPKFEYKIISTQFSGTERSAITVQIDLNSAGRQGFKVIGFDMVMGKYTLCREIPPDYEYATAAPMEMNEYAKGGWEFVALIPAGNDIHYTQYLMRHERPEPECVPNPLEYRRAAMSFNPLSVDDFAPDDLIVEAVEILQDEP
jgi:hypothetical protein